MSAPQQQSTYLAIMAGGVGSRFWPASREATPKQFLDILGVGKSLLRLTFERFLPIIPADRIYIVTNELYREQVLEHLPEISSGQVICEPSRNNTAPCVAFTAYKLLNLDPEANLIFAPSDALILDNENFRSTILSGLAFTEANEAIVTLGIQPTSPNTGYGYIEFDQDSNQSSVHVVNRFTEKPPLETAKAYLQAGNYLWNAGIFMFRAAVIRKAFAQYATEIHDLFASGDSLFNTSEESNFLKSEYPKSPSISVDYAIMEKADNIYTIPSDFGWSDLGTWNALYDLSDKSAAGNVTLTDRHVLEDTAGSLIRIPEGKTVVVKGLEDYIIVDESDVLLIWPKSDEQAIKAVRQKAVDQFKDLQ